MMCMRQNLFIPNAVNIPFAVASLVVVYLSGKIWFCVGYVENQAMPPSTFMTDVITHPCFGNYLSQHTWMWAVVPILTYVVVSWLRSIIKSRMSSTVAK